jgi:hypothetical protein
VASTSPSLILATTSRLPVWMIEPFIVSLRASGYQGQLGLVVGEYDQTDIEALDRLADFTYRVDQRYEIYSPRLARLLKLARDKRGIRRVYPLAFHLSALTLKERTQLARWEGLEYRLEGLQALRYGIYYDVLQQVAPWAERILLTDIRDVVFQGDPFDSLDTLEVFLEDPSRTIGAEPHNRRWVEHLFGAEELARLEHKVVSCSGTVIGPRAEILHYLREMSAALVWRRRPMGSHDQGVHNFLLHAGRFGSPRVVENGYGRVLTMGGMEHVTADAGGRVLNADGTLPPVLHQYDRHPPVAEALLASLGAPLGDKLAR